MVWKQQQFVYAVCCCHGYNIIVLLCHAVMYIKLISPYHTLFSLYLELVAVLMVMLEV